jgi:predicted TIM-barrel fold metal-dependent hydrolase
VIFDFQTFLPSEFNNSPFSADDLLQLADTASVDYMVVMPPISEKPDNESLADRIGDRERLIGCASVNPTLGEDVVKAFEESIQRGMKGLHLLPRTHRYAIDSDLVSPLLDVAQARRIPVTTESCSEYCHPVQIANLAGRFPEVSIIADVGFRPVAPPVSLSQPEPEAGRIADQALNHSNLYLGLTALATAETYLIKRLLDTIPVDRLVFGSNAPSGIPLYSVGGVRQANLGDEAEALFLGETLKKIYHL